MAIDLGPNEFIFYTDIHYYNNPQKSYIRDDGISSWLYEQLLVTHTIFKYAKDNYVETIIFGGDLFEEKNRISVALYNYIWRVYKEYSKNFNIIFNTGNHDIISLDRNSAMYPFSDIVHVISVPTQFRGANLSLEIIPYGMTEEALLPTDSDYKILITHEEIEGLEFGNQSIVSKGVIKREDLRDWNVVLNGHIHKPQDMDNIINVGSCFSQDFGEADNKKRFIHFKNGNIKSIPVNTPEFIIIEELNDRIRKVVETDIRNFYRINIDSSMIDDSIFQKYNVTYTITKTKEREIRLRDDLTDEQEIEVYINSLETELDKQRLMEVGREFI